MATAHGVLTRPQASPTTAAPITASMEQEFDRILKTRSEIFAGSHACHKAPQLFVRKQVARHDQPSLSTQQAVDNKPLGSKNAISQKEQLHGNIQDTESGNVSSTFCADPTPPSANSASKSISESGVFYFTKFDDLVRAVIQRRFS